MNSINFHEMDLVQVSDDELFQVDGGTDGITLFSFTLTGVLDDIKHNTECHLVLFGKKIF